MELKEFVSKVKSAKPTPKQTGFFGVEVKADGKRTSQIIYKKEKCSRCGTTKERVILVKFFKPQQLTIFQAEMLFAVYALGKKPADYANYHKCVAGEEFIANIKSVEVAKND